RSRRFATRRHGKHLLRRLRQDSAGHAMSPRAMPAHDRIAASAPRIALPALARVAQIPARILLGAIWLYQRTLSPALPILTLGRCGCRFSPTCSHYAADAVRQHGALRGTRLAVL